MELSMQMLIELLVYNNCDAVLRVWSKIIVDDWCGKTASLRRHMSEQDRCYTQHSRAIPNMDGKYCESE